MRNSLLTTFSFLNMGTGRLLFITRWLLAPFYLGLVAALCLFLFKYLEKLVDMFFKVDEMTRTQVLLSILHLLDIVMVANLLVVTTIGSFALFIRHVDVENEHDKLPWLKNLDAMTLKMKLVMALIGVSSVHLLEVFIAETIDIEALGKLIAIHLVFVVSAIAISWMQRGSRH